MTTPKKDVAYTFFITLGDKNDSSKFKADPTLAVGDFKVSVDEGVTFANLGTLPTVTAAGSIWVKVSLATGEMADNKVLFQAIDAAGDEWADFSTFIDAPDRNVVDLVSVLGNGTAQSGTASTIVLAAADAFADDVLNGTIIKIIAGTGVGQARVVISNTLTDDTVNVAPNWTVNPSSDSVYEIVAGSVNVEAISLDNTAANNLELDYDGTGFAKTNSTMGLVTLVTTTTTNSDMRGTDSAFLAASAPANFSSLVISAGGAADTLLQGFLNTLIVESTAGRIAANFDNFYDNADSVGTLTLDAVALASSIGTVTDLGGGADLANNLADMAGATFSSATDSLEAIRDRGDAAWTTGAGGADRLLLQETTIATLASQTSFTLTAGSADSKAYEGCTIVIEDASTAVQKAVGIVDTYTGGSLTITLLEDPAVFTMAAGDNVYILAEKGVKPTTSVDFHLDISSGGTPGVDWANVDNKTSTVVLSGTTIGVVTLVDTTTANTDMRGTDNAFLAASAPTNFSSLVITVGGAVDSLLQGFLNTLIAESTAGRIAANFDNLYDNADALATLTLDTISTLVASDIVSDGTALNTTAGVLDVVNLTNTTTTNTDMRGTDSAFLAASAPTNFSSLVISVGGAVDSLVQGFLNTLIVETTAGRIAANFDNFYDNADAVATLTLDAVALASGVIVSDKTGFSLASTGLDLIVPAEPSGPPVFATATIVQWIAYFGAWSTNEVDQTATLTTLRNNADSSDIATHVTSDDSTTFVSETAT